ncbi:hypothetical protein O4H49_12890 [Kiloniella laminariae]|uniref:Uncharacterized protein n=1 Tax=Kiloniella laminariae TaxID=454162 RepID=A0ABT4LKP7_9PROT|nr:hypothetical protein [Kiloniella laminariae]MCZ4281679.1 hypothetical protein [Kiloniella laminariae]
MPYEKAHPESPYTVKEKQLTSLENEILEIAVCGEALYLVKSSVSDMVDSGKVDMDKLSAASFSMGIFQKVITKSVRECNRQIDDFRVNPKPGTPKKTIDNKSKQG